MPLHICSTHDKVFLDLSLINKIITTIDLQPFRLLGILRELFKCIYVDHPPTAEISLIRCGVRG